MEIASTRPRVLKMMKYVFGVLVLTMSGYGLWTEDFRILPFMLLMLGCMSWISGMVDLEKRKVPHACFNFFLAVAVFVYLFYAFVL